MTFALALFVAFGLMNAPVAFGQGVEDVADALTGISGEVIAAAADGTATSIGADGTGVLVVVDPEDGEFVVTLDANYELRTPGSDTPSDVASALAVGAKVAVLAETNEAGELVATQVLVKPTTPTTAPVTGAVVARDGNTITIVRPDGTVKTIELPAGAVAPAEGEIVTAFVPEEGSMGGAPTSTGLVRAEEVSQRLNAHLQEQLDELESPDLPEAEKQVIKDRLARVASLFEEHSTKRVGALEKVLASGNIPEAARTHLEAALGKAQQGFDRAMAAAGSARESAGLPEGAGRPAASGRPESGNQPAADDQLAASGRPEVTPSP